MYEDRFHLLHQFPSKFLTLKPPNLHFKTKYNLAKFVKGLYHTIYYGGWYIPHNASTFLS